MEARFPLKVSRGEKKWNKGRNVNQTSEGYRSHPKTKAWHEKEQRRSKAS